MSANHALQNAKSMAKDFLIILLVLLVVDIIIVVTAIHYIMACSQTGNWNMMLTILLIILLFIPGYGTLLALGFILYGLAGGCKPKLSFAFY